MFVKYFRNVELYIFICFVIVECFECVTDVIYEGRNYVSEGDAFIVSCLKSAYGAPKWTKNGLAIDPNDPEYVITEENLPANRLRLVLGIRSASWKHRGAYKCDILNSKSHTVEIVPSKKTDEEMRKHARVQLKPNKTLKLFCDQEENSVFPINWYKDGRRILETEDDPRIRMADRTLWISNAKETDAGDYMCVVEVSGLSYPFADHLGSRIKVTYPARVELFPKQMRPILNRNLTLECKVQGFPIPRMSWFVDGIPIDLYRKRNSRYDVTDNEEGLPNSVFIIRDVMYGDGHEVACVAENMDNSSKTLVQLAVRENKISTNEEYPGKGLILIPGQEIMFLCNDTDDPSAKFQWYKNGVPLNMTDVRLHVEASNNTLLIQNTVENDCGSYTCSLPDANATIVVRTMVKLGPFDNSRNVVQGQNIVLICNVTQGIPLPTLQWLKDEEPLNTSDPRVQVKSDIRGIEGTELVITEAEFEDRAEYTCIASNEISSVNATILVRVKDKYAALWPFLGICAEVAVLCTIIFIYEKRRQKPDFDESEAEHNTENKNIPDQEEKSHDIRQRK